MLTQTSSPSSASSFEAYAPTVVTSPVEMFGAPQVLMIYQGQVEFAERNKIEEDKTLGWIRGVSSETGLSVDARSVRLIRALSDLQRDEHTPCSCPYHTFDDSDGFRVISDDHICKTAFYSAHFARLAKMDNQKVLAAFVAGLAHDIVLGPGGEKQSARIAYEVMCQCGYDIKKEEDARFISEVCKAVMSTRIVKNRLGKLVQCEPLSELGVLVAAADVIPSVGGSYENYIEGSARVRQENLAAKSGTMMENTLVPIGWLYAEMNRMVSIFENVHYPNELIRKMFPNAEVNVRRVKKAYIATARSLAKRGVRMISPFDFKSELELKGSED